MSEHENIDTSPDTEEDTASGGPAEPRDQSIGDEKGDAGAPSDPASTDADDTPVENPAG